MLSVSFCIERENTNTTRTLKKITWWLENWYGRYTWFSKLVAGLDIRIHIFAYVHLVSLFKDNANSCN